MYFSMGTYSLLLAFILSHGCLVIHSVSAQNERTLTCYTRDDCKTPLAPICCGKTDFSHCTNASGCVGISCDSSFECDEGRMWCCSNKCKNSYCIMPIWAIVLVAMAVAVIVTILLIYIILECCRRWPNVRRAFC